MEPGRGSPWERQQKPLMSHLKLSRTKSSRRNDPTQPASRGQNELMGCGARVRVCMCGAGEGVAGGENTGTYKAETGKLRPAGPSPQPSPCMASLPPAGRRGKGPASSPTSSSSIFIQHPVSASSPSILVWHPHSTSWASSSPSIPASTHTPSGQLPAWTFPGRDAQ